MFLFVVIHKEIAQKETERNSKKKRHIFLSLAQKERNQRHNEHCHQYATFLSVFYNSVCTRTDSVKQSRYKVKHKQSRVNNLHRNIKKVEINLYPTLSILKQLLSNWNVFQIIENAQQQKRSKQSENAHAPTAPLIQLIDNQTAPHPKYKEDSRSVKQTCNRQTKT